MDLQTLEVSQPMTEELITLAQGAELVNVSASTLRRAASSGELKATLYGKTWLTTKSAVEAWYREANHKRGPRNLGT